MGESITVTGHPATARLIAERQLVREQLAALERAEHPHIIDRLGRVWVWRWDDSTGSYYAHCGRHRLPEQIESTGVATRRMLNNQNYDLCPVCVDGRERRVRRCEHECTHPVCKQPDPLRPGARPYSGDVAGLGGRPVATVKANFGLDATS